MQERDDHEKRIQEGRKRKKRLRPLFRAFAENFDTPFNEAMAFGIWLHLHSIHSAPAAKDVPADNTKSIVAFFLSTVGKYRNDDIRRFPIFTCRDSLEI